MPELQIAEPYIKNLDQHIINPSIQSDYLIQES
jgi:hypothetical protein